MKEASVEAGRNLLLLDYHRQDGTAAVKPEAAKAVRSRLDRKGPSCSLQQAEVEYRNSLQK